MRFWVVASNGLVGKEMCEFLKKNDVDYIGTTKEEVDVRDAKAILKFCKKHKPTHIVNCSAYVNVDEAERTGAPSAFELNVEGPMNLAQVAKKRDIHLIHIGTDYVFDGEKERDYTEEDLVRPINVYGLTKEEGERRMLEIYPSACCVRTASLYGTAKQGLVYNMLKGLQLSPELTHISDQTSSPTNVKYLVRALYDIRDQVGIYQYVNKGSVSRFGLLQEVQRLLQEMGRELKCKKLTKVTRGESQQVALRPRRSVLSTNKIEPYLTFHNPTWQEALREYLEEVA